MDNGIDRRQTARLVLRRPNTADSDFVVDLFSRLELVAHRPHPVPDSPEISEQRLLRDMQHWQSHGFGRWAVEHDGRLVGFGGLTGGERSVGCSTSGSSNALPEHTATTSPRPDVPRPQRRNG
jgi:ribosomal-protein-alanine N-acetyltransferase